MLMRIVILATAPLFIASAAHAADAKPAALFGKLLECKAIADPTARLSCYDSQVGALAAAEQRKDIVVVDREQMRETRKSLFGFPLPKLDLFGGGSKATPDEDVSAISSTIASTHPRGADSWVIVVADGGTWETTDPLKYDPRPGQKIEIRKAMMGSYLGTFGSNRGIRLRRVG